MELRLIDLRAYACYSGEEYVEEVWIKEESFQKIKDNIESEIDCGELDGKYSQVMGDVDISYRTHKKEDIENMMDPLRLEQDGIELTSHLRGLYLKFGMDFNLEQKEIKSYIDSLDYMVEIRTVVHRSERDQMLKLIKSLN